MFVRTLSIAFMPPVHTWTCYDNKLSFKRFKDKIKDDNKIFQRYKQTDIVMLINKELMFRFLENWWPIRHEDYFELKTSMAIGLNIENS